MNHSSFRADVVVTTIGSGKFLQTYTDRIDHEGLRDRVRLVVIADLNTPREIFENCAQFRKKGFNILCPTVDEQDAYLRKLKIETLVPHRTDNRRNIGFLMSMEQGVDFMISVDDDNYPTEEAETTQGLSDFFSEHAKGLGSLGRGPVVESPMRWFNICSLAQCQPEVIWPRGFPYQHRKLSSASIESQTQLHEKREVRVNAGLWTGDPDVDAISRIALKPVMKGPVRSVVLGQESWTPINTQNTAIHREAMPAYYYFLMARSPQGFLIDRFGDIFSGFFVQATMKHFGHLVRVGTPLVFQERNEHYLLKDLHQETMGLLIMEELCNWLTEVKLSGSTYAEAYRSLSELWEQKTANCEGYVWTPTVREYCRQMAVNMRQWLGAVAQVSGG